MPRLDHTLRLQDRLTPTEHAFALLLLRLVNPLRAHVHPPLPPLTEVDIAHELRQVLREQAQGRRHREEL